MGSGKWSAVTYNERADVRTKTGKDAFDFSRSAIQSGQLRPHQTLDPSGLKFRESRDSQEHPNSNAIIIGLDVTGSMGRVVRGIHANLPQLHELLLGHHCISDPQIMFAAVGDATCDRVPLQVGQFESDNRMDENLENMLLEGGGGGQKTESYELMLYLAARHTAADCWDKRKRKGYLFIIGDELAYPEVSHHEVNRLIGDGLQGSIPFAQIVEEARERYHVYFVLPGGASHGGDRDVVAFWKKYLGDEYFISLQSPGDASESIALAVGIHEGAIQPGSGAISGAVHRITQSLSSLLPGGAHRTRRL